MSVLFEIIPLIALIGLVMMASALVLAVPGTACLLIFKVAKGLFEGADIAQQWFKARRVGDTRAVRLLDAIGTRIDKHLQVSRPTAATIGIVLFALLVTATIPQLAAIGLIAAWHWLARYILYIAIGIGAEAALFVCIMNDSRQVYARSVEWLYNVGTVFASNPTWRLLTREGWAAAWQKQLDTIRDDTSWRWVWGMHYQIGQVILFVPAGIGWSMVGLWSVILMPAEALHRLGDKIQSKFGTKGVTIKDWLQYLALICRFVGAFIGWLGGCLMWGKWQTGRFRIEAMRNEYA